MSYRRRSYYSQDPKWITAKFNSKCHQCGGEIKRGSNIFYYPKGKHAYCETCGTDHSNSFDCAVQDEEFYQSQY